MCFAGVYGQLEDRKLREEPADGRKILERCLVTYIYQQNVNPVRTASLPANTKERAQQQASKAPKSTSEKKNQRLRLGSD